MLDSRVSALTRPSPALLSGVAANLRPDWLTSIRLWDRRKGKNGHTADDSLVLCMSRERGQGGHEWGKKSWVSKKRSMCLCLGWAWWSANPPPQNHKKPHTKEAAAKATTLIGETLTMCDAAQPKHPQRHQWAIKTQHTFPAILRLSQPQDTHLNVAQLVEHGGSIPTVDQSEKSIRMGLLTKLL